MNPMNPYDQYQQYLYQEKMYAKYLRRTFSVVGWTLVIYYVLMNTAVVMVMMVDVVRKMLPMIIENPNYELDTNALVEMATQNGWGYIMAVVIGLFVLLVWKGKDYWRNEIFAKGKPMTVGTFFAVMSITLGVQLVASLLSSVLELLLNQFGLSMMSVLESTSGQRNSFSMFIDIPCDIPYVLRKFRVAVTAVKQPQVMSFGCELSCDCTADGSGSSDDQYLHSLSSFDFSGYYIWFFKFNNCT